MIPRDAWPFESATRRALTETVADGRHEWQRAKSTADRARAIIRFMFAFTRALVMASTRECAAALRSPFAWRWLAIAAFFAVALPSLPLLRVGFRLQHLPRLDDCLVASLVTTPISVYLCALSGRRTVRVPVGGMAIFVSLVVALVLLLALPVVQARYFAHFSGGRHYLPAPLPMIVGFGVPCLILCACALLVAECARTHERRAFLSCLGFLLPIAVIVLYEQFGFGRLLPTAVALAMLLLVAALPLAVMWLVLVRYTSHQGAQR